MFIEDAHSLIYKVSTSLLTMRGGKNTCTHDNTAHALHLCVHDTEFLTCSLIWSMKQKRGRWTVNRVYMGGDDICHSGLVGAGRARYIISFGEDESGKNIYLIIAHVLWRYLVFRLGGCLFSVCMCILPQCT